MVFQDSNEIQGSGEVIHRNEVLELAGKSKDSTSSKPNTQEASISSRIRPVAQVDSLTDTSAAQIFPGLFVNHELKEIHNNPQPVNRPHPDWLFYVLLFVLIAFTWLKVFYNKNFRQILGAIGSINATNQIVRDENILVQRASVILTVMFNIVASVFLYQLSVIFEWPSDYIGQGFSRFMIFAVLISCVYSFKFLLLKLTGHIFKMDKPIATYIFNIFLINNILGVFLIPLLISIAYMPAFYASIIFKLAIIIVLVSFIYRISRGIIIGLSQEVFSIFYLFLYLCTLEIAPLLILIKLFA
jgi:hypothetical protein